jgi:putative phosphoserine phosphatase/1-acylglycerol-3-phosphate O-acyltransferase
LRCGDALLHPRVVQRSRSPGALDVVRTLLALLAILPGLLAGLLELAFSRDRRRAVNRAIQVWGELGTEAAGMQLDVEGWRHLEERPAVFLLNHQSGIDPILVCALLRRDFVGVAKQEIRRNPVLGPAFAFAGVVFVDRFDHTRAVRALEPAIDTLHAGIAIAIAPEGTRRAGLGRFKKGGFRLAMAAKVPVVPIVLHDSCDVLPRGAWIMTGGRVHVTVHAPIPTDGWSPDTLDAKIAAVEQLYHDTLASAARKRSTRASSSGA